MAAEAASLSLFVLSGEESTLPAAEIHALAETYSRTPLRFGKIGRRLISVEGLGNSTVPRIAERAAYCRFGGELLGTSETISGLEASVDARSIPEGKKFVVASETLDKAVCGEIGALIKAKTGARVSLENPDYVFQAEDSRAGFFALGLSRSGFKEFSWRTRRPRARRFFLPSAIYPKFARLLVNLSRVREGEYFLDPFCGTGSLIIESSIMGMKSIGGDLTRWIARGAKLNMQGLSLDFEGILRLDATHPHFPLSHVDAISTDVPYGRAASTKGKATEEILREFSTAAVEILAPTATYMSESERRSKYCVVMHPSHVTFDYDKTSFELAERHLVYVHRTLTRAISVLKRKLPS